MIKDKNKTDESSQNTKKLVQLFILSYVYLVNNSRSVMWLVDTLDLGGFSRDTGRSDTDNHSNGP